MRAIASINKMEPTSCMQRRLLGRYAFELTS
jgi:hypothetical protein